MMEGTFSGETLFSSPPTVTGQSLKKIAFTFDDGPNPQYTDRLLKILNEYHVPATFFVVGKQVERYPQLLRKIFQEKHELANHTYSHRNLKKLSFKEFKNELEKTHQLVQSITEQKMKFFRPPGGHYDQNVIQRGKKLGYTMILWTMFPKDHINPSPEIIRNRVLNNAGENGIALFHGVENTLSVLPELIVALRKRGYSFVTLSQLPSEWYGF